MHLQIVDDLKTVHNDQLVYLNRRDIALTLSPDSRYGQFITVKWTESWWLSGLACQSIDNTNAQGQGFKSGRSHLKFGRFQFSRGWVWTRITLLW